MAQVDIGFGLKEPKIREKKFLTLGHYFGLSLWDIRYFLFIERLETFTERIEKKPAKFQVRHNTYLRRMGMKH